jgi:hypothetical protein
MPETSRGDLLPAATDYEDYILVTGVTHPDRRPIVAPPNRSTEGSCFQPQYHRCD